MKKFLINTGVFLTSISLFAFTAHAQGVQDVNTGITTLAGLIDAFTKNIVKSLGTMFLALGVVAFFYGVVQYIWGVRQGETAKITAGNKFMGVGLLALFVMFSVYGIIKLGQGILFNGTNVNKIDIPEINFVKGTGSATTNTNGGGLNGAGAQMTCPNGIDKVPASLGIGACPSGTSGGGSGTGGVSSCSGNEICTPSTGGSGRCSGGTCVADSGSGGGSGNIGCTSVGEPCTLNGVNGSCATMKIGGFTCNTGNSGGASSCSGNEVCTTSNGGTGRCSGGTCVADSGSGGGSGTTVVNGNPCIWLSTMETCNAASEGCTWDFGTDQCK